MRASGKVLAYQLDRVAEIGDLGAGRVDAGEVPAAKLAALAKYGLASKAPTLRDLEAERQTATLLATVRHLETSSVDDALDVLDLLVASELLAKAERAGKAEQLRSLPKLRSAARQIASAMEVLMGTDPDSEEFVSLGEAWKAVEEVVPRDKLAAAPAPDSTPAAIRTGSAQHAAHATTASTPDPVPAFDDVGFPLMNAPPECRGRAAGRPGG